MTVGGRQLPVVECPACGRKTEFSAANPWRPFCCERCKTIDLGAWASGAYQIAGSELDAQGEPLSPEPE